MVEHIPNPSLDFVDSFLSFLRGNFHRITKIVDATDGFLTVPIRAMFTCMKRQLQDYHYP